MPPYKIKTIEFLLSAETLPFGFRRELTAALDSNDNVDREIQELADVVFPEERGGVGVIPTSERFSILKPILAKIPEIADGFTPPSADGIRTLLKARAAEKFTGNIAVKLQQFVGSQRYGVSLEKDSEYREALAELRVDLDSAIRHVNKSGTLVDEPDFIIGGDPKASAISIGGAKKKTIGLTANDLCLRTGVNAINRLFRSSNNDQAGIFDPGATYVIAGFPGQFKSGLLRNILYDLPRFSDLSEFRKQNPGKIPAFVDFDLENRLAQRMDRLDAFFGNGLLDRPDTLENELSEFKECAIISKIFPSGTKSIDDLIQYVEAIPAPYKVIGIALDYLNEVKLPSSGGSGKNNPGNTYMLRELEFRKLVAEYSRSRNLINLTVFQLTKDLLRSALKIVPTEANVEKIFEHLNIGEIQGTAGLVQIADRIIACVPLYENEGIGGGPQSIGAVPTLLAMKNLRIRDGRNSFANNILIAPFASGVRLRQDFIPRKPRVAAV